MKVIKKINNNVAICIDSNHHELIAFGNGIGFPACPYDIEDLSVIKRTFYGVESRYFSLLTEIDEQIFEIAAKIIDIARNRIDSELNPNILFTLADHINFAIQRSEQHLNIKNPLHYDIQHLYTTEMEIGEIAVEMIMKITQIHIPKDEAGNIAMHFINAETTTTPSLGISNSTEIIQEITTIIKEICHLHIDEDSFNYSRFVTHLQYLLKRQGYEKQISSDYREMYHSMKEQFPSAHLCVESIREYLDLELKWRLNEEELLYLMLHVNRLCAREDCYPTGITPTHKDL